MVKHARSNLRVLITFVNSKVIFIAVSVTYNPHQCKWGGGSTEDPAVFIHPVENERQKLSFFKVVFKKSVISLAKWKIQWGGSSIPKKLFPALWFR